MSRGNKGGTNPRFNNGKKIPSIYSPKYKGTRVPDGQPGNHKPLLDPVRLGELLAPPMAPRREPTAIVDPMTGEDWVG